MRGASSLSAAVLVAGLTVLSSTASAADPKNVKEAEQRFTQGVHLMAAGKPDEARVQFAEANALVRSTDILWNLIGAEEQSGHYADAMNHARQFVRDPKSPPADVRETNAKLVPDMARRVGQVEIDAPSGAQIEIDSKEKAGHAPLLDAYAVVPGSHEIVAITATDRFTKAIEVAAGETVHVALGPAVELVASPPEIAATKGTTPSTPDPSPQGATDQDQVPSDNRKTRYWVTAGFGAGAALLVAGSAAFFFAAQSSKNAAAALQSSLPAGACPAAAGCADLSRDLHAQNDQFAIGAALLIGAGVAAAGGAVSWFVLGPHRRASTIAISMRLAPSFSLAHPGFLLRGSF